MIKIAFLATLIPLAAAAQDANLDGLSWTEQKCVLYQRAVDDALDILGHDGINDSFLAANQGFIDDGCLERTHICPRSEEEYALVNMLTLMTMNEGMASTFVPFGCRD